MKNKFNSIKTRISVPPRDTVVFYGCATAYYAGCIGITYYSWKKWNKYIDEIVAQQS